MSFKRFLISTPARLALSAAKKGYQLRLAFWFFPFIYNNRIIIELRCVWVCGCVGWGGDQSLRQASSHCSRVSDMPWCLHQKPIQHGNFKTWVNTNVSSWNFEKAFILAESLNDEFIFKISNWTITLKLSFLFFLKLFHFIDINQSLPTLSLSLSLSLFYPLVSVRDSEEKKKKETVKEKERGGWKLNFLI